MSDRQSDGIQQIGYIPMPGTDLGVQIGAAAPIDSPEAATAPWPPVSKAAPPAPRPAAAAPVPEPPRAYRPSGVAAGKGTFVSPNSSVVGQVTLGEEVFVAPLASIRADTGAPIHVGNQSNVQDGAVVHCAEGHTIAVNNKPYAVYIGERVTLAHRCLVHGPVAIHDDAFIGFGAFVLGSTIGRGAVVMHMAYVSDVDIPPGRMVPPGTVVDTPEQARSLPKVSTEIRQLADGLIQANRRYARQYLEGARRESR